MRGTKVERSPGVWRFRVFTGSDPATGHPRQASRTFRGTKEQADSALAEFVSEVANATIPLANSTTLAIFLDRWIDHITPTRSPTTIRGYRFKIARIDAKLGSVRLDELSAEHLNRAYREWLQEGLDPSSVHHLHRVMSAALRQAVKWGLLVSAPTTRATPPVRRAHPTAIPTPEMVQSVIETAEERGQPVMAAVISVASTTGLRRGELAGLRWSDVELESGRLYVRRSIKNDLDGSWIARPPKSHQIRCIALDSFTIAVLRHHRSRIEAVAAAAEVAIDSDAYVFTLDPSGAKPIRPDLLSQSFARLCRAADISGISLQTFATSARHAHRTLGPGSPHDPVVRASGRFGGISSVVWSGAYPQ